MTFGRTLVIDNELSGYELRDLVRVDAPQMRTVKWSGARGRTAQPPEVPVSDDGRLVPGTLYLSSHDPDRRLYLPRYELRQQDGRFDVSLRLTDSTAGPDAPTAWLTVGLFGEPLSDAGVAVKVMAHEVRLRLGYHIPVDGADAPAPGAPAGDGADAFLGSWTNTDARTRGITRVRAGREDGRLRLQVWGSCHPRDCDWGTVDAQYAGGQLKARFQVSFKTTTLTLSRRGDRLFATVFTDYAEGDRRSDRRSMEVFEPDPERAQVPATLWIDLGVAQADGTHARTCRFPVPDLATYQRLVRVLTEPDHAARLEVACSAKIGVRSVDQWMAGPVLPDEQIRAMGLVRFKVDKIDTAAPDPAEPDPRAPAGDADDGDGQPTFRHPGLDERLRPHLRDRLIRRDIRGLEAERREQPRASVSRGNVLAKAAALRIARMQPMHFSKSAKPKRAEAQDDDRTAKQAKAKTKTREAAAASGSAKRPGATTSDLHGPTRARPGAARVPSIDVAPRFELTALNNVLDGVALQALVDAARLKRVPKDIMVDENGDPPLVRKTARHEQVIAPFSFEGPEAAAMFDLPDQPGGTLKLLRVEISEPDSGASTTFYADSLVSEQYYYEPQGFALVRDATDPHRPSVLFAMNKMVDADGEGGGESGSEAGYHYEVRMSYRLAPRISNALLAAAQRRFGESARFAALMPSVTNYVLRVPPGGNDPAAPTPRPEAQVSFDDGIVDELELSKAQFEQLVQDLQSGVGVTGSVRATLADGQEADIPVWLSLTDNDGPVLDSHRAAPESGDGALIVLRNRIESPVAIAEVRAAASDGDAPGWYRAGPLPDTPLAPGAQAQVLFHPNAPGTTAPFEPIVERTIQPDLKVLLPMITVSEGYNSDTFTVEVNTSPVYFETPDLDGRVIAALRVEFNNGQTVDLTADTLHQSLTIPRPLLLRLIKDPDADTYSYRVTRVHETAADVTGAWITTSGTDLTVGPYDADGG